MDTEKQDDSLEGFLSKLQEQWAQDRATDIEEDWRKAQDNFDAVFEPVKDDEGMEWRNESFYPLTELKVNSAYAQIVDILFKKNKIPFNLKVDKEDQLNIQMERDLKIKVDVRMEAMENKIDSQLQNAKAVPTAKAMIFDNTLMGTCVSKTLDLIENKITEWNMTEKLDKNGQPYRDFEDKFQTESSPDFRRVDPWNWFPDSTCMGDLSRAIGMFERQYLSESEARDMLDNENYIEENVDHFVKAERGTNEDTEDNGRPEDDERQGRPVRPFIKYIYYGDVKGEHLVDYFEEIDEEEIYKVNVEFGEGYILRVQMDESPNGTIPYQMSNYSPRSNSPWGNGIAYKLFDSQARINTLLRSYLDGKQFAGINMFVINKDMLDSDENDDMYPGKIWRAKNGFDISRDFLSITVPDTTDGLIAAVGEMIEWGDVASTLPKVLEGNPGVRETTAYAESQRIKQASKQLGMVLRELDDKVWDKVVSAFMNWNMVYHPDEKIKGSFVTVVTGYSNFQIQEIRAIELESILNMATKYPQLAAIVKSEEVFKDWAEVQDLDPSRYLRTKEEVADVRKAEAEMQQKLKQQEAQDYKQKIEIETQGKIAEIKAETEKALKEIIIKHEAEMKTKSEEVGSRVSNIRESIA